MTPKPRVTRQMFIEEYTRQLLIFYPRLCTDMDWLGIVLVHVANILDGKIEAYGWYGRDRPIIEKACRVLGIPNKLDMLRKLPKE